MKLSKYIRAVGVIQLVTSIQSGGAPLTNPDQKRKRKSKPPAAGCSYIVCTGVTSDRVELRVGERLELLANASDPDGDELSYRWETTGGTIVGYGAKVNFDATGVEAGTYTVTAIVSDKYSHSAECSTTIRVIESDSAPN